jgi:hypothetical protein
LTGIRKFQIFSLVWILSSTSDDFIVRELHKHRFNTTFWMSQISSPLFSLLEEWLSDWVSEWLNEWESAEQNQNSPGTVNELKRGRERKRYWGKQIWTMRSVWVEEWWGSFHLGLLSDPDDDSDWNIVIILSLSVMIDYTKLNSVKSIFKIMVLVQAFSGEHLFVSFDEEIVLSERNVHSWMTFRGINKWKNDNATWILPKLMNIVDNMIGWQTELIKFSTNDASSKPKQFISYNSGDWMNEWMNEWLVDWLLISRFSTVVHN